MESKILAIDTASSACSVAARIDGKTCARVFERMSRGQSEALVPMVMGVLSDLRMKLDVFDLIAVTRGPGAFTGLRIGLATARGLSLASNVPCFGVTTTQAIAEAAQDRGEVLAPLVVALDSKRSDIYIQVFNPEGCVLSDPEAIPIEGLRPRIDELSLTGPVRVVGDASDRVLSEMPEICIKSDASEVPDAAFVAQLAERLYIPGTPINPPAALYLRPADAALPKDGGRLRA